VKDEEHDIAHIDSLKDPVFNFYKFMEAIIGQMPVEAKTRIFVSG